jgi:CRP-like cAMP-binding protein
MTSITNLLLAALPRKSAALPRKSAALPRKSSVQNTSMAAIPNLLLAALPRKSYAELLPGLTPVELAFGHVLYEPGQMIDQVYFPGDSMVSLLTLVEDHLALEVGLVGFEGMVGSPLVLGVDRSPVRALVQGSGSAMRMSVLLRYVHALMSQVTQTAACNRFHVVEARLARWLLMTRDRMHSDGFRMTQDFLSNMLGVRRVGVTEAAGALQRRKLIEYSRGVIAILDGRGLEAAACSCYRIVSRAT